MPWLRMRSRTRGRIKEASSDAAIFALEALSESADGFPPLKSVVGGLIFILKHSETMNSNKGEARRIEERIDHISALLEYAVPDATDVSPPVVLAIQALDRSLQHINEQLSGIRTTGRVLRFLRARMNEEHLREFHRQLDEAIADLHTAVSISLEKRSIQTNIKLDAVHGEIQAQFSTFRKDALVTLCFFYVPVRGSRRA
ncbi:hypothetical protein FA95DRAFT_402841 [Auriscalpium vulgare]|uniref:Uncharacterized protein n=1 Tax=Auriscalpium vulgare TaxID=40419 RepID=A0ACB8RHT7_9AGAM|nr:hypothetical protein FA95DRAFT_402841 [Auriscalpium vulgare]